MQAVTATLAEIAIDQGDPDAARRYAEESFAVSRDGDFTTEFPLFMCGHAACHQGDLAAASTFFTEHLALVRQTPDSLGVARSMEGWGMVAARGGRAADAARLFGAAEAMRDALGRPFKVVVRPLFRESFNEPADLAGHVEEARAALDASEFQSAWTEGRAMPVERALDTVVETVRRSMPS